jgi:hypothetical protein
MAVSKSPHVSLSKAITHGNVTTLLTEFENQKPKNIAGTASNDCQRTKGKENFVLCPLSFGSFACCACYELFRQKKSGWSKGRPPAQNN